MRERDEPMPLSELSGYIDSVRRSGQGEYVPVVDMGRIVDDAPAWRALRVVRYAAAACVLLSLGCFLAVAYRTESITIASDADPKAVARMVSEEGGSVFSVVQRDDGDYELRVFSFRDSVSLLERLRRNKEIKRAELAE